MTIDHCVLLAGGLGTRLQEITGGFTSKVLVPIDGIPFLHLKLLSLKRMGFTSVDILIGQHGDQIIDFLSNNEYPNLGIRCLEDGPKLLGTAGAIATHLSELPQSFWVSYADSYVKADIQIANSEFSNKEESIMIVLHNLDEVETSNVSIDTDKRLVTAYTKNPMGGSHEWIDYGLLRFSRSAFLGISKTENTDLMQVIISEISKKNLRSFETKEKFWDIGNPKRLIETELEFRKSDWG